MIDPDFDDLTVGQLERLHYAVVNMDPADPAIRVRDILFSALEEPQLRYIFGGEADAPD
jgi:hypothetical protein